MTVNPEWDCFLNQVLGHELGGGGVEGWTSRESPAEDPGDGGPAGQTQEGEITETVSAGVLGNCPAKTETKGQPFFFLKFLK